MVLFHEWALYKDKWKNITHKANPKWTEYGFNGDELLSEFLQHPWLFANNTDNIISR